MIDKPEYMAKRARIRFRRAQFGYNNKRPKYASNNPYCDYEGCDGKEFSEDTEHVAIKRPRHARNRDKLMDDMATLLPQNTPQPELQMYPAILDPHSGLPRKMAQQISKITGEFILLVHRNKKF